MLLVNTVIRLVIQVIFHVLIVFVLVTCSWSQGAWPRPTCQYFRSEMDPSTLPWVRPASWVETPSPGQCMSRSVCSSVCLSVVWLCVSLPLCVCVCVALCLYVSHCLCVFVCMSVIVCVCVAATCLTCSLLECHYITNYCNTHVDLIILINHGPRNFPLNCIAVPICGNHGTRSFPLKCIAAPIYGNHGTRGFPFRMYCCSYSW